MILRLFVALALTLANLAVAYLENTQPLLLTLSEFSFRWEGASQL